MESLDRPNHSSSSFQREDLSVIDNWLARFFLAAELLRIPEFRDCWAQAREAQEPLARAVKPKLEAIGASLSPEGRGALLMNQAGHGLAAYGLYEAEALREAEAAARGISAIEVAWREADYRSRLQALVEPLGVPGLADAMEILDNAEGWKLHQYMAGPVAGPMSDLLEAFIVRGLTGLSPAEAMSETKGQIARRIERKLHHIRLHFTRYGLARRITLWVQNVVYGESIDSIAKRLPGDGNREMDAHPYEWVKQQIREASEILGAERRSGRPRKGGVLRHWKLMS